MLQCVGGATLSIALDFLISEDEDSADSVDSYLAGQPGAEHC